MCRSSNVRVRLVDDSSGVCWVRSMCGCGLEGLGYVFVVVVICIMDFLF